MPQILSSATVQTPEGSEIPTVFSDLLKDGCFWIDILDPSDFDMQILAKVTFKPISRECMSYLSHRYTSLTPLFFTFHTTTLHACTPASYNKHTALSCTPPDD